MSRNIPEFLILSATNQINKVAVIYSFDYFGRTIVVHDTVISRDKKYTASDYMTSLLLCLSDNKEEIKHDAKKVIDEAVKVKNNAIHAKKQDNQFCAILDGNGGKIQFNKYPGI